MICAMCNYIYIFFNIAQYLIIYTMIHAKTNCANRKTYNKQG